MLRFIIGNKINKKKIIEVKVFLFVGRWSE